jgi:hypothetical protein
MYLDYPQSEHNDGRTRFGTFAEAALVYGVSPCCKDCNLCAVATFANRAEESFCPVLMGLLRLW